MKASENELDKFEVISSGFAGLDEILGCGGFPTRKITEISGRFSMGKSTLALQAVAQAQRMGKKCLYADSELSYSNHYATELGVDGNALELIQQTEFAEELLDGIEKWAMDNKNGVIVLDSVGGLLPREEAEKGSGSRSIGLQARLIGSFSRRIVPLITTRNHALLILNHEFTDIGTGRLKTSGGEKLSYAKSIWFTLKRTFGKSPKRSGTGLKTVLFIEAEIRKNKVAPTEGMKTELVMTPGKGFAAETALLPLKKRGRPKKI